MRTLIPQRWWAALGFVASIAMDSAGATTILGGNLGNQTWTPAGSPYIIQGDVTVIAGSTLTIQAGTVVLFDSLDSQFSGLDVFRVEMTVRGSLDIAGSPASPVVLRAHNGSTASIWYGLVIGASASSVTIANAEIQHAFVGIRSFAPGTALQVRRTTVATCATGIESVTGSPSFDIVRTHDCSIGIQLGGAGAPVLTNVISELNTQHGISVAAQGGNLSPSILNSTLNGNSSAGLYVSAVAAPDTAIVTAKNLVVTNNGIGIDRDATAGTVSVAVTYSDVWSNGTNYFNAAAGIGAISADPHYLGEGDFHVTAGSPAIDTGDDAGAPAHDYDGTTRPLDGDGIAPIAVDMGAYEAGLGPTVVLGGTLPTQVWTPAGSPYLVKGNVTIPGGASLAIQPGTMVRFASGWIRIDGALDIAGSAASPVTLEAETWSAQSTWYGIVVGPSATSARIAHAAFRNASYSIDSQAPGAVLQVTNTTIDGGGTGVISSTGSPSLDAVLTRGCGTGIYLGGTGAPQLTNVISRENRDYGIEVAAYGGTLHPTIVNTTLDANQSRGLYVRAASLSSTAIVTAKNLLVTSGPFGIYRDTSSGSTSVTVTYSDVWNNETNYFNVVAGTGNLSVDPIYEGPYLRVAVGSPVIDAGDGADAPTHAYDGAPRPLDGDGVLDAAHDMGAFEASTFVKQYPGLVPETPGGPQPVLRVSTANRGETVDLQWGAACGTSTNEYAIHQGTLGSWYSHVPVVCTTSGFLMGSLLTPRWNTYYLVVPMSAIAEGVYGHATSGPIPASSTPCRPVVDAAACP